MSIRDVLIPYFDEAIDEPGLDAVDRMAVFKDAHMAALLITALPAPIAAADASMSAMLIAEVIGQAREEGARAAERLRARSTRPNFEVRALESWSHAAVDAAIAHARSVDIAAMTIAPEDKGDGLRNDVLEGLIMESGRAVLALPAGWRPKEDLKRVMLAWDATREAVRASSAAAPFFAAASEVFVVTVDAQPSARGLGEVPGAEIATHIARGGCDVEVRNVDGFGRAPAEAIMTAAKDMDADLIVMGAFHHARLQQALFGGVTRTLLNTAKVPLLLAH